MATQDAPAAEEDLHPHARGPQVLFPHLPPIINPQITRINTDFSKKEDKKIRDPQIYPVKCVSRPHVWYGDLTG